MTRPTRTPHEEHALSVLVAHLEAAGHSVGEDDRVRDAPDALLFVGEERVACECSHVALPQVIGWYRAHSAKPPSPAHGIIRIPNEPHMWIARTLEKKRLNDYKGDADQSWLVVHTSAPPGAPLFLLDDWTKKAMAFTAAFYADQGDLQHRFDRLWLIYGTEAHLLWKRGDPLPEVTPRHQTITYLAIRGRRESAPPPPNGVEYALPGSAWTKAPSASPITLTPLEPRDLPWPVDSALDRGDAAP